MAGRMVARLVAQRHLASLVHLVFQFLPGMCFLAILAPRRFSESAQRTTWPSDGRFEKCP